MSAGYILTAAAKADIRSIIRYTPKQHCDARVRAYAAARRTPRFMRLLAEVPVVADYVT